MNIYIYIYTILTSFLSKRVTYNMMGDFLNLNTCKATVKYKYVSKINIK